MTAERKRAEAMARADAVARGWTEDDWDERDMLHWARQAAALDAYFAHTWFIEMPVGPGNFVQLKPEPIDELGARIRAELGGGR